MTQSTRAHPKEPNPTIFQQLEKGGTNYLIGLWFVACLQFRASFVLCFALFRMVIKTSKYLLQEYARVYF